jgi:calcineurin-like phosphoesterase family protein
VGLLNLFKKDEKARTSAAIHAALTRAHEQAATREIVAGVDRYVIFSDHHKGSRDGADDFQRSERSYNAALAYYDARGYHLVELGDVEELWENEVDEVVDQYEHTLRLAASFQSDGRYTRLFGNHDIAWKDVRLFQDKMRRFGYGDVEPIEALRLVVNNSAGEPIVEFFLAHGHQGTASSDRYAWFSKVFVRFGWRRLQRLLNRPWTNPSMDWNLRGQHAKDMETWAAKERVVLIAGHTHKPVFFGAEKQPEQPVAPGPGVGDAAEQEALRLARLQWDAAEKVRLANQPPIELDTPCYFNTGCCSFGDGDITGIEIRDGEIMLVRWPCDPRTRREVLDEPMKLVEVKRLISMASR